MSHIYVLWHRSLRLYRVLIPVIGSPQSILIMVPAFAKGVCPQEGRPREISKS
jgi:hypothetical protein